MRLEHLLSDIRITHMSSYEKLQQRIREIRDARVNYVPTVKKKKQTKATNTRKKKVDKLVDGMSEAERLELLKALKGEDG